MEGSKLLHCRGIDSSPERKQQQTKANCGTVFYMMQLYVVVPGIEVQPGGVPHV